MLQFFENMYSPQKLSDNQPTLKIYMLLQTLLRIHYWLIRLPLYAFIGIMLAIDLCMVFLFGLIATLTNITDVGGADLKNFPIYAQMLVGVVIAPLLETLEQHLLIKLIRYITPSKIYAILGSAIVFGLSHSYSLTYMIYAFFPGILLAYIYLASYERNEKPIWNTFLEHGLYNLILISLGIWLK